MTKDKQLFVGRINGGALVWTDGSKSAVVSTAEGDVLIVARPPLAERFKSGLKLIIEGEPNLSPAREAPYVALAIRQA
jgi:hypothetical protein